MPNHVLAGNTLRNLGPGTVNILVVIGESGTKAVGRPIYIFGPPTADVVNCAKSFRGSSRSEEHTSELQSLMRISYAVFCLKKKTNEIKTYRTHTKRQYAT